METEKSMLTKFFYITFVVILYWFISILMVFVNKSLLSSDHLNAPFFIAWFQCLTTLIIIVITEKLATVFPKQIQVSTESYSLNKSQAKKMFMLSAVFTTMILSNNLCLKYVEVAFYYIGRSLTTVFNVIFTYLIIGEKLSCATITTCGIIVFGFLLGLFEENLGGSLSVYGVIFGVLGSLSVSLYSIGTKKILPLINQDIWRLSYYNNLYSSIMFVPLILLNGEIESLYNYDKLLDVRFWGTMLLSGILGFAIGFVTTLQIKVTSALTHNISGTSKSCVQTVLATYWYDNHKSSLWWVSNFLVLGGSAAYARVKQLSMIHQAKLKAAPMIILYDKMNLDSIESRKLIGK